MILAAERLAEDRPTEVDIAVVGAGAVGIALVTRLAGRVGRVALIEAGGLRFERSKQDQFFKAADVTGLGHPPGELYRRRMLGGTTSIWGGRCIPMDREDFLPAEGRSGWPIDYDDVARYYSDALAFLHAGRAEFGAAEALPSLPVKALHDDCDLKIDRVERFSEPTDVWKRWGGPLSQSPDIMVVYGATCTGITTNSDGSRATGLKVRTVTNKTRAIIAPKIILAAGGLETPRLLLFSNQRRNCGLGNEHGLVGRYYMTHLAGDIGHLRLAESKEVRNFDYGITPDNVYARRLILLKPSARETGGIGNIVFRPSIPRIDDASHGDSVLSAMFIAKRLIIPEYARRLTGRGSDYNLVGRTGWQYHLANITFGLPRLSRFGCDWLRRRVFASRKLPSVFLRRSDATYPLEFNAEQLPNLQSRVLLDSQTDPFGVPRLAIRWATRNEDIESITRAYRVLAAAVDSSGCGTVELDPNLLPVSRRAIFPQAGHHMGTARMGDNSHTGVVDKNAEVWGTRGLFLAGAAIFPTSGFANPTLTAVALGLRLADYLIRQRQHAIRGSAVLTVGRGR